MNASAPLTAAPARWSWPLIISLALNLLVVGAVIGALISHQRHGGQWPGGSGKLFEQLNFAKTIGGANGLRAFVQTLPAERRALLRPAFEEARRAVIPLRDKSRALRDTAHNAFTSEPYDAEKAANSALALFEADLETRRTVVQHFSRLMGMLTPEERARFFAWRQAHEPPGPPIPPPPAQSAPSK